MRNRIAAALILIVGLAGCETTAIIKAAGDASEAATEIRQGVDRIKLDTSIRAFCGSGLDVHLEQTARKIAHATAATILCGDLVKQLLKPD